MRWYFALIPGIAWAETGTSHLLSMEGLATTLFGLLLVLALIFILAWIVKRLGGLPLGGSNLIRILGGVSLGARERIMVVEIAGTRLVLGVAPGRVQTLYVLPKHDVLEPEQPAPTRR